MSKRDNDPFFLLPWTPAVQEGCARLVWQAPPDMKPRNIQEVLRHELGCSGTVIRRLRQPGTLLVDGAPARVRDRIAPGSILEIWLSEPDDSTLTPEPLPLAILFEDEHLLAVDKSDNIPVHPSNVQRGGTLANAVSWHLRQRGEGRRVHPVTRLDRNTAGITLFTKTAHAQHVLTQQAHSNQFHKEYLGVSVGQWDIPSGSLRTPIRRKAGSIIEREAHPDGDPSVTHFEVLQVFTPTHHIHSTDIPSAGIQVEQAQGAGNRDATPDDGVCSLVRFQLETGRTHQIRVHCAAKGHPLLGDTLYGGPAFAPLAGQALVCDRVRFRHPITNEPVELRSGRDFPMFQLGFTPPS